MSHPIEPARQFRGALCLGRRLLAAALGIAVWIGITVGSAAGPVVSNVRVAPGARLAELEVRYDLASEAWAELNVTLAVSSDGGSTFQVVTNGVSWEVGNWTKPGTARRIVWRAPLEWLGESRRDLRFRVSAREPQLVSGMVPIKPGRFTMGSPESEVQRYADEGPTTEVSIAQGFWLGKYEVTQKEWETVMGNNPSHFKGDPDLPVESVSWTEAMEYCRRLTQREREAGRLPKGYEYRLPTEAEWEYACRAGTKTAMAFGDRLDSTQANFDGNHPYNGAAKGPNIGRTVKVGSYPANVWGLHDMHGNVWEWCVDWYEGKLSGGTVTNPSGPKLGSYRVLRGGSWYDDGWGCRSANRSWYSPSFRNYNLGFRAACAPVLP